MTQATTFDGTSTKWPVFCPECGQQAISDPFVWRCNCGGAWEFLEQSTFDPASITAGDASIWRYAQLFELPGLQPTFRMGTGWTPLLPAQLFDREVHIKPEYFAPSGSFKDRGTEVMINILASQGVDHVVEDSSGNAGASVAAFAARAGMQADIFVPAHASPVKQAQIAIYGANVRPIPGPRANAKLEAIKSLQDGIAYASHAYHPGFLLGQETVAWETWEQLGHKAPDWYIVPVGQGVHLLGVWLGFRRLLHAGLIDRLPRLVAVQPELLDPVYQAFEKGLDSVPAVEPKGTSLAEGLAIANPVRGKRILQALRETGGCCVTVSEAAIQEARLRLSRSGFYAEPTSATVVAALPHVLPSITAGECVILPLTGTGLKGSPKIE